MATCEKSQSATRPYKNDAAILYGHDSKKFRLRAVSAEKDSFSKYIGIRVTKRISWAQIILAIFICAIQIVSMTIVTGRYSYYDSMAGIGGGLWSSLITISAAVITLWSLKNSKYWKLHLSFALHIINMVSSIVILMVEFGGNIHSLKYRLGEALYGDDDVDGGMHHYSSTSRKELSASMLTLCLIFNTIMATGTLVQLVTSFVLSLMTGRALCCGQSRAHGKLFELEIAGSETTDGLAVLRSHFQSTNAGGVSNNSIMNNVVPAIHNVTDAQTAPPPPYAASVEEFA